MISSSTTNLFHTTLEGHDIGLKQVAYAPSGQQLASLDCDGKIIKLWDSKTMQYQATLEGHLDRILSVAFAPSGRQLASGSHDKAIKLWNIAQGATPLISNEPGESAVINHASISAKSAAAAAEV